MTAENQNSARRFTLDGSPGLEQQLESLCKQIRKAVLDIVGLPKLKALVLGGGYGRGQGGVLRTQTADAPYNDLEFYVFLRGHSLLNDARFRQSLQRLGESLSPKAGVHIEFKIDSLEKFRRRPVSIFSYDLVSGHRILHGSESLFQNCEEHLNPVNIVPAEATRLLLNRCSGLLLAQELLLKDSITPAESDFIGRNLAKAKLAVGDALLAAEGKYHWDCLERSRRVRQLDAVMLKPALKDVVAHHAAGVRFKLHPILTVMPIQALRSEQRQLTDLALAEWLWIENRRLKTNFLTVQEYSFSSTQKCGQESRWRNLLLNIRTFGAGATLDRNSPRYPRERLFNALPLLLGERQVATQPDTRRHLQRQLRSRANDWHGLVAAYKQVWSCYG